MISGKSSRIFVGIFSIAVTNGAIFNINFPDYLFLNQQMEKYKRTEILLPTDIFT